MLAAVWLGKCEKKPAQSFLCAGYRAERPPNTFIITQRNFNCQRVIWNLTGISVKYTSKEYTLCTILHIENRQNLWYIIDTKRWYRCTCKPYGSNDTRSLISKYKPKQWKYSNFVDSFSSCKEENWKDFNRTNQNQKRILIKGVAIWVKRRIPGSKDISHT